MSAREDQQPTIDRLTEELARAHEELRLTRLVLARTTIELATCTARLRIAERVIERLA